MTSPSSKAPPATPLSGTVRDPDGKAVAGARVMAVPSRPWAEPIVTTTGADGVFRLPVADSGPWHVRVEAAGLAAAQLERVGLGARLEVRLTKGKATSGVVRDGRDGRPLSGVRVEARAKASWAFSGLRDPTIGLTSARTDAKGRFQLLGLGPGFFLVEAKARGFGPARRDGVAAGETIELSVFPAASITGIVYGPGRRPVQGASVWAGLASRPSAPPPNPEATDARGRFFISGLEPGAYTVRARHPDLASGRRDVDVEPLAEAEVEVELAAGIAVTGRLTTSEGRPVPGRVTLQEGDSPSWDAPYGAVRPNVGADGRFTVEHVPVGEHALAVQAPGYVFRRVPIDVRPRDASLDLGEIVLERGLTISGRVTDRAGAPIEGATVSAYAVAPVAQPGDFNPAEPTQTRPDGSFVLGGLAPGRQSLSVGAPGFAPLQSTVEAGTEHLQLVLSAGGTLTGIVADPQGRPLDTFQVLPRFLDGAAGDYGHHPSDVANGDGRFTFDGLLAGRYSLRAEAPDWAPNDLSSIEVAAGRTTDVGVIRLRRGGIVRGTVVDASGTPVAGATVTVGPSGMWGGRRNAETQSRPDGAFEIRGLAPAPVVVRATHPAYAPSHRTGVDVDPGHEPAEVKLVLSAGGRIQGSAKMRSGTPLTGARVWVTPDKHPDENLYFSMDAHATVQDDGSFLIEHLPPGPVTVRLAPGEQGTRFGGDLNQSATVVDGQAASIEFALREILVTGRVTRAGAGVPNVRVTVVPGDAPGGPAGVGFPSGPGPQPLTGVTEDDGSYSLLLHEVGPATGLVTSLDGSVRYTMQRGTIPDADRFGLDFTLRGVPITGVVVDKDTGAALERAQIGLRTKEGQEGGHVLSGSDGRFALEVEPGEYLFGVAADGYSFAEGARGVGPAGISEWRVELSRGRKLHGRLVDAAGRPASGVPLLALGGGLQGLADFTVSMEDGAFRFDRLRALRYDIAAASPLGIAVQRDVAAGDQDLVLTLMPAGRVRLTIVDGRGAPASGAQAHVTALDGRPLTLPVNTGSSDAAGVLELTAPAGRVEVEALRERLSGKDTVRVEAGATSTARVVLGTSAEP